MQSHSTRAGRWPLALTLALVAACADQPTTTAPTLQVNATLGVGTVFTVTSTGEGTAAGTLRWAMTNARSGDAIRFDPRLAGDTIAIDAPLETSYYVTIEGPPTRGITVSGRDAGNVLRFYAGGTVRNITVTGGFGTSGNAIFAIGQLRLEHSTVTNNRGNGAPVFAREVTLVNSTVSGNTSHQTASGIRYIDRLTLVNSTVAHNYPAPGIGTGAVYDPVAVIVLHNSIVAHNGSPLRNCASTILFRYEGMNIANDASCGNTAGIVVTDPRLLGLADNGGPSMTEAFDSQSPALNAGSACQVAVDQRYVARDADCDVGAFEFTDFTRVSITIDPNASVDRGTGSAVVSGTVKCSRDEPLGLLVKLEQQRDGNPPFVVKGTGGLGIPCSTTAKRWSTTVASPDAGFSTGSAVATASTNDVPVWVTPATTSRSVKLQSK